MNALRYRPLAVFSIIFYICACFFAELGAKTLLTFAAVSAAALSIFIFIRKTRIAFIGILVFASVLFSSLFSLFSYALQREKYSAMEGRRYISGTVMSEIGNGYYIARAEIDNDTVKVCLVSSEFLSRGDTFRGQADISLISDNDRYCKNEGIYLSADAKELSVEYGDGNDSFNTLNNRLSSVFAYKLGKYKGGFASAVLFGNRKDLSPELYSNLKNLGLSHLIALSGLHLTVICGIVCLIIRPFGKKAVIFASVLTSVFYMLFTDMSPSIVRAGVMLIVFSVGSLLKRDGDAATALGATALTVTLISPAAVFDLGFQLSLSAVAGVRCASAYLEEKWYEERTPLKKLIFSIISPFAVGIGATVFTLAPLLIYYGTFTWVGALMTVPMAMLLTLIIWMLPPLLIIPFDFYRDTLSCLIGIFEKWANGFSDMGEFTLISSNRHLGAALAMAAALGSVLALCSKRKLYRNAIFITSASLIITLTAVCTANVINAAYSQKIAAEETSIGDIIAFKNKNVTLAIDVTSGSENASQIINETALALGDSKLDALIIAAPHSSHYNALAESYLLYAPDVIYLPEGDSSESLASKIGNTCKILFYRPGDSFFFGEIKVEVLPSLTTDRSTLPSLAFAVTSGNEKTVYLGSSYIELGGNVPDCDKLYLGSYGPLYKKTFTVPEAKELIVSSKAEKYLSRPLLP